MFSNTINNFLFPTAPLSVEQLLLFLTLKSLGVEMKIILICLVFV